MSTPLVPKFTVPLEMNSFIDKRPEIDVTVDLTESSGLLGSMLSELSISSNVTVDDVTAQYIEAVLVESVASPFPSNSSKNIGTFFHSSVHPKVDEIVQAVKDVIRMEVTDAERCAESMLNGEKVFPDPVRPTIIKRSGHFITLAYRMGIDSNPGEVTDPITDEDIDDFEDIEDSDV